MTANIRHRIDRVVGPDKQWVIPQLIGLAIIVVAIPLDSRRHRRSRWGASLLAPPLIVASAWVAGRAKSDLADSFTMSPTPVEGEELVEHGMYGSIRHPMYLSVLLFFAGYTAAWRSSLGVASLVTSTAFLIAKVRHEERALSARYESYPDYCDRVRWRFLPGIV